MFRLTDQPTSHVANRMNPQKYDSAKLRASDNNAILSCNAFQYPLCEASAIRRVIRRERVIYPLAGSLRVNFECDDPELQWWCAQTMEKSTVWLGVPWKWIMIYLFAEVSKRPSLVLDGLFYLKWALSSRSLLISSRVPYSGEFYVYTSIFAKHVVLRHFRVLRLIVHG